MVRVATQQVAPLLLPRIPIRIPYPENAVPVGRVLANRLDHGVVPHNLSGVCSPRKATRHAKATPRAVHRHLVRDGRELFLARVSAGEVIRAHAPSDVGGVGRPDRPREAQPVVLRHRLVLVRPGWEMDVLVEELGGEVLAELVESCGRGGLAHQGLPRDVVEAVAPAQHLDRR